MENIQGKFEEYQRQISTKQKIALLIESIKALEQYGKTKSPFQVKEQDGFQFDIVNTVFRTLFAELQNDLIAKGFIVDLDNTTIDGLREDLKELAKNSPVLSKIIDDSYGKMSDSFYYIRHRMGQGKTWINLITLLLENGQAEKVVELVVSDDVPKALKKEILHNIISNYPSALKHIFNIVPSSYDNNETDYKERFKGILNQNLAEVLDDPVYNEATIRTAMKSKYPDESTRFKVKGIVEFFVEHNLVDINDITWDYNGSNVYVSSASIGYISGNAYLGRYLYSLPSYQQTDPTTRLNSDKVILERLLKRGNNHGFDEFIRHQNYESTPEKLNHLMQVILQAQPINPNIIDDERLDKIIGILLRKTKKQDYKDMKRAITDIKTNTDIDLLNKGRQELVGELRMISDELLSTVPATTVISAVKLKNKNE